MALKLANNAATTLSSAVTSSATSIAVVAGSSFPTLGVADYTYITLATPDASKIEVVKATAISGNTFTVVRGQDNTTAQTFSVGDLCELRVTAAILESHPNALKDNEELTFGDAGATGGEFSLSHHDSGYTHLKNTVGTLFIDSADVVFRDYDGVPERLKITSTGSVEMGGDLDVTGNVTLGASGGNDTVIISGTSSPSHTNQPGTNLVLKGGDGSGSGSSFVSVYTSEGGASGTQVNTSQERVRISPEGNVGIGEASPSTALHIKGSTADSGKVLIQSATLTNNNRAALFMSSQNVNGNTGNVSIECIHPNNQQSDFVIRTGATDATSFGTERFRITTTGNVGIGLGSSTVNARLHSNGSALVGSGSLNSTIGNNLTTGGLDIAVGNGTKAFQIWDDNNTSTPRFIVERAGNVGIGVVPESGWNQGTAFQVGSNTAVWNNFTESYFLNNLYYQSGFKYQNTGGAAAYRLAGGQHTFYVAASGNADASITPTSAMTITSTGNVGIGTSSPTTGKLTITQGTDPGTTPAALNIKTTGVGGGTATAQYGINVDCSQSYNNSLSLHGIKVVASQNVGNTTYGIESTVNPGNSTTLRHGIAGRSNFSHSASFSTWLTTAKLPVGVYGEVNNTAGDSNHLSTSAAGYFWNKSDAGAVAYGVYINTTAGPTSVVPLRVDHDGSAVLTVDSTGDVEMSGSLDVTGSVTADGLRVPNGFSIQHESGAAATSEIAIKSNANLEFTIDADSSSTDRSFRFFRGAATELFRVQENGNVGIGITNPDATLETTNNTTAYSAHFGSTLNATGDNVLALTCYDENTSNTSYLIRAQSNTTGINEGSYHDRFAVMSTGNVGIGVTPESWNTAYSALQIGGISALYANSGTTAGRDLYLVNNVYHTTGGTEAYIIADEASLYKQQNGTHEFKVAPSGTADTAISWTTALTIANTGNVGIGTSSPVSGRNVHINNSSSWASLRFTGAGGNHLDIKSYGNTTSGSIIELGGDQPLRIYTNGTEKFRITSSGNVGIGTSSPSEKLHVQGDGADILLTDAAGGQTAKLGSTGSNNGLLELNNSVHTSMVFLNSSGDSYLKGGNVGIGVTPKAWNSAFQAIQVGSATSLFSEVALGSGGSSHLSQNAYYDGAWKTFATGKASTIRQHDGTIQFYVNENGSTTAGSDPWFSAIALQIKNDGLLYSTTTYNGSTTSNSGNLGITSTGQFIRVVSSAKYKKDIETMEDSYADAILDMRPVWFRSKCESDPADYGYWGLIAEEVAEIDPRLAFWKTKEVINGTDETGQPTQTEVELDTPEIEGVQYDRIVPHLINLLQRQRTDIQELTARLESLENK